MSQSISPEFALAVASLARPRTEEQHNHLRALAATGVDGERLLRICRHHGICGLVADALWSAGLLVPEGVARCARRRAAAALRQTETALDLQKRLAQAGIPVLLLKGTALAQHIYGNVGLRDAVDIDLAVARAHVARAWNVLDAAGYRRESPRRHLTGSALRLFMWAAKDSFHRHPDAKTVIELHWRLSDDLVDPRPPSPTYWRTVAVAPGRTLTLLADEALFIYLCTHGAAHMWSRLKWLADVAALVRARPDGGQSLWHAAQQAGAQRAAASALMLTHDLFGIDLPGGFIAPRSWRIHLLNKLAVRAVTADGGVRDLAATPYRGWAEFAAKLLIAPGPRNMLATGRRILFSPEDMSELALPGALAFLYPLLRLPLLIARRSRRAEQSAGKAPR